MPVEFRLLGSVEAHIDGRSVDIGPARQQLVLVALLLDANRIVPDDRLVDRVWGAAPPASAANTLRSYLTRLRQAIGSASLVRRAGG